MLGISDTAAEAIKGFLEDAPAGSGLRIDAAGPPDENDETELEMSIADEPVEGDQVIEQGGARVFVSETLSDALSELTLDAEAHGDHYHFGSLDSGAQA
jgi:Fe-S cluster assembly iron-binding protein IscA